MASDFEALRGRIAAVRLSVEIAKAGTYDDGKHPRFPKGDPHGGQFAPKDGSLGSWLANFLGYHRAQDMPDPSWQAKEPPEPFYTVERKGSALHPATDYAGRPAYIFKPTEPTGPMAWRDQHAIVTVTPGSPTPKALGGVPFAPAPAPEDWKTVEGQNPQIEEGLPDLQTVKGKHPAAGIILEEPDGRIWLTKPLNHFGGYHQTFPKGTQEPGLTLQQTAIKEAWEETGLKVKLVGVLGDFERNTSVARYYIAERTGGDPSKMGWESQALRLVPAEKLPDYLNMPVDREILRAYLAERTLTKARVPFVDRATLASLQARIDGIAAKMGLVEKGFDEGQHPRWPKGSPLGGQFMEVGANGIIAPPKIGSQANPQYQKKAQAAYEAAQAGDVGKLHELLASTQAPVDKYGYNAEAHAAGDAAGAYEKGPHSQAKWAQQTHQYIHQLIEDHKSASVANLTENTPDMGGSSVPELANYKKIEAKPGGSNPGAVYEGPDGKKYLVKGANYPSDDRAKNEVLASKLMQAAGVKAPNMHLVDLGKQYGGGLGVASEMEPMTGWHGGATQINAAQKEFAVHAWLANYDAAGTPAGDNFGFTKDGKLFNYDPGGALLYRAQGLPKNLPPEGLQASVAEWNSMRDKGVNPAAAKIYGSMTNSDLANAAEKLKAVDDKTIADLVAKYGPGTPGEKLKLAATLIKRRDDILYSKAGLPKGDGMPGVAEPSPINSGAGAKAALGVFNPPGDNIGDTGKMYLANAKTMIEQHAMKHGLGDGAGQLNAYGAAGLYNAITGARTTTEISNTVKSLKDWSPNSPELVEAKKHLLKSIEHTTVSTKMQSALTDGGGLGEIEPHFDQMKTYNAIEGVQPPAELKHYAHIPAVQNYVTNLKVAASTPGYANALAKVDALQAEIALSPKSASLMGPSAIPALNEYSDALKTQIKAVSAETAAPPAALGKKPTKAGLKPFSAAASAAVTELDPTGTWAKEALQAQLAINTGIANHDPESIGSAWEVLNSPHWVNATGNGSHVVEAHAALSAYANEADAYLMAHPKKVSAAAAKWSLQNPPTAADFPSNGHAHMDDVSAITDAYKQYSLGDGAEAIKAKAEYWNDYVKANGGGADPTKAGWRAIKIKADYANALMVNAGQQPIPYVGSNYAAANEARHEAALMAANGKPFGPGNAPKSEDFYTGGAAAKGTGIASSPLVHQAPHDTGHLSEIDKITEMHAKGDKAGLSKAYSYFNAQAATGKHSTVGGMSGWDGNASSFEKPLSEAGIKNQAVKAAYAKGLLDDLRSKQPAAPFAAGDKPTTANFEAALGHNKPSASTVAEGYSNIVNKLDSEGVGGPSWGGYKKQFESIAAKGAHANKPAADLMLQWMQQQEDYAAAEATDMPGIAADASKPVTLGATWKLPTKDALQAKIETEMAKVGDTLGLPPLWAEYGMKKLALTPGTPEWDSEYNQLNVHLHADNGSALAAKGAAVIKAEMDAKAAALGGPGIAPDAAEVPKPNATTVVSEFGPGKTPTAKDFIAAGGNMTTAAEWQKSAQTYKQWHEQALGGDMWAAENLKKTLEMAYDPTQGGPDALMHGYMKSLLDDAQAKAGGNAPSAGDLPALPNFQHTTKTAKAYYEGLAQKMNDAYLAGDMAALKDAGYKPGKQGTPVWPTYETGAKAGTPKTANGKLLADHQAALISQLSGHQAQDAAATLAKPVGFVPSEGQNVGSNPAMPNFDRAMIPTENSNAGSHNAKVFVIKQLAQKGDVKGLLALNYGTNTYGKKQAKLANDALAAMGAKDSAGNAITVAAGQKKNSHPMLQAAGVTVEQPMTPTGKKLSAALTDKEIGTKLDFANYKGAGQGLSSKAALNSANQAAADNLYALAKAGDVKGIKNATYAEVTKEGTPTGNTLKVSDIIAGQNGSQHIKNLQSQLLQTMDEKLHPPEPLKFFAGKAFNSVQELHAAIPPAPFGTTTAKHPTSQTIGYFLALGQVSDPTNLVPAKQFDTSQAIISAAHGDYSKMSPDAQKYDNPLTGTGGKQFADPNHPGSYYISGGKEQWRKVSEAAHEYARELPEGTVIYKWDNLTPDMKQKLSLAQPGLVIQNPAPVCASYKPTATAGFGSSHRFKIIMAKGAKVVSTFSAGSHASEGEWSLLPNYRVMVLGHEKNVGNIGNGPYSETTVLLLPPDPALDKATKFKTTH